MTDLYAFWRDQLAGKNPETRLPAQPEAGFYRRRRGDKAYREALKAGTAIGPAWSGVAIWKDGEEWCCACQHGFEPRKADEIAELFASICRNAVSEEVYRAVVEDGKPWPDEVAERHAAGPNERQIALYAETDGEKVARTRPEREGPAEIGDNSGEIAPFEIMRERIADVGAQVKAWLAEIGGAITTQAQADKAANYADLFAEIEKEATLKHKVEKEPVLKAAREIDGAWKPVIELADASKRKAKGLLTPFLVEQKRLADEAARIENERLREESQKAREAQEDAARLGYGEAPTSVAPPPTVAPAQVKAGTRGRAAALRTVKKAQIDDIKMVAAFLAGMETPNADFVEVCQRIADRMIKAGVTVPGATLIETQIAA